MSAVYSRSRGRRAALTGLALAACLALGLGVPSLGAAAGFGPHRDAAPRDTGLSAADIERYRRIFAVQADGAWADADGLIAGLDSEILLGHVLAQRYLHPTDYRSSYQELAAWLERYADHPDASRIYRLAMKRKPKGAPSPCRPVVSKTSLAAEMPLDAVYLYQSKKKLTRAERRKVQRLKRRIRSYVRRTYLTKTERLLEQAEVRRLFDRYELDEAYSLVAAGWFYYGKPDKAYALADAVAERSGAAIPTAYWTAGLAAWSRGRLADAGRHFGRLAVAEAASDWNRAAGAYWAARVTSACRTRSRPTAGSPSRPASLYLLWSLGSASAQSPRRRELRVDRPGSGPWHACGDAPGCACRRACGGRRDRFGGAGAVGAAGLAGRGDRPGDAGHHPVRRTAAARP